MRNSEKECENLKPEVKKKPKPPKAEDKKEEKAEKQTFDESDDDTASVKSDQTNVTNTSSKATEPVSVEEEEEIIELFVDPSRKLAILNDMFLKEFAEFVSSFASLFIKPDIKILSDEVWAVFFVFVLFVFLATFPIFLCPYRTLSKPSRISSMLLTRLPSSILLLWKSTALPLAR